jgi:hypothetical protein
VLGTMVSFSAIGSFLSQAMMSLRHLIFPTHKRRLMTKTTRESNVLSVLLKLVAKILSFTECNLVPEVTKPLLMSRTFPSLERAHSRKSNLPINALVVLGLESSPAAPAARKSETHACGTAKVKPTHLGQI